MSEVFPIVPASAKPIWFLGVVLFFLGVVFAVLAYTAWSSRHSRVELSGGLLHLRGDLWARSIPIAALQPERGAVIDLTRSSDYEPRGRTFGTRLPGYASGWFRLRNGEKALAYLTRRESVLYLPTSEGYALLLSAERPQQLLESLRARTGR
jgi:hypothetical protein